MLLPILIGRIVSPHEPVDVTGHGTGWAASAGRDAAGCGARGVAEETRTPWGMSRESFGARHVSWGTLRGTTRITTAGEHMLRRRGHPPLLAPPQAMVPASWEGLALPGHRRMACAERSELITLTNRVIRSSERLVMASPPGLQAPPDAGAGASRAR